MPEAKETAKEQEQQDAEAAEVEAAEATELPDREMMSTIDVDPLRGPMPDP